MGNKNVLIEHRVQITIHSMSCNFETVLEALDGFLALHELHKNVERFWETDQVVTIKNKDSIDEEYCQDLFQQTTTRAEDGRFIVRIPFKVNPDKHLGSSYNKAVLRFQWLETKLSKSEDLKLQYSEFIQEYIRLKHMSPSELKISKSFFLPHHCVIRESSETTKLRVVFDGSSKPDDGKAINELQHIRIRFSRCYREDVQADIDSSRRSKISENFVA
ncbi:hypothetical protein ILUMI_12768 [Ignelater luminosus]|uniref:Uncharacterized protein n=1 Tax=Ignelater luminosus TaxID=2038154 RepID=A0A8K0CTK7_IGNLU|nr:hypothetical protein ILUMI_12768 [Ignelater luminosus]